MPAVTARRIGPEPGKPFKATIAKWELVYGADLLADLLAEPALLQAEPRTLAARLAARTAELIAATYACVCVMGPDDRLEVLAEHGAADARLRRYMDQRATSLAAASRGEPYASAHTTTERDAESERFFSYVMTAATPTDLVCFIAAFRDVNPEEGGVGFDPFELEQLRWFTASVAPLLTHANRTWSAQNALRAESGTMALTSYADIAHQLLFANIGDAVRGHLADIRSAVDAATAVNAKGEREEHLRRLADGANLLERYTSRAHIEAEADARLPRRGPGRLHPQHFLEVCATDFRGLAPHILVVTVATSPPEGGLPQVRVDLGHLYKCVHGLLGLLASFTASGAKLTLAANVTPYHVCFALGHDEPLADPDGLRREAPLIEALGHAIGGVVVMAVGEDGVARLNLCIPRVDTPEPEPVGAGVKESGRW